MDPSIYICRRQAEQVGGFRTLRRQHGHRSRQKTYYNETRQHGRFRLSEGMDRRTQDEKESYDFLTTVFDGRGVRLENKSRCIIGGPDRSCMYFKLCETASYVDGSTSDSELASTTINSMLPDRPTGPDHAVRTTCLPAGRPLHRCQRRRNSSTILKN
jgi:hypothetical protein